MVDLVMSQTMMGRICEMTARAFVGQPMGADLIERLHLMLDSRRPGPCGMVVATICPLILAEVCHKIAAHLPPGKRTIEDEYAVIHLEMVVQEHFSLATGVRRH